MGEAMIGRIMRRTALLSLLALALAVAGAAQAGAQTVLDKIRRDETIWLPKDDPDMATAMHTAREALPQFLALWRAPRPSTSHFAVKVGIHDEARDLVEYFWITPFVEKDGRYSGQIDNEPDTVKTVKLGDTINFGPEEIVDWLYVDGGDMKGNYTACSLLRRAPRQEAEAAIKRFRMSCEL
jgi:uncharacterized protein YegJ (DUF2314 family)